MGAYGYSLRHTWLQVRKEAAYALCNACGCNDAPVLAGLVQLGLVVAFCDLLDCFDATLLVTQHACSKRPLSPTGLSVP